VAIRPPALTSSPPDAPKAESPILDLTSLKRPTVIEIWAPGCGDCRAMQPHLNAVAERYRLSVDLMMIDASAHPETVRALGVWGTPTLIGVSAGRQVFRHTGRRAPAELEDLFLSLANGTAPSRVTRSDLVARTLGGTVLIGVGLSTGPIWPLVAVGGLVLLWGLAPLLKWWR